MGPIASSIASVDTPAVMRPGADVQANLPQDSGDPHYAQINDDVEGSAPNATYVGAGVAGTTDIYTLEPTTIPEALKTTQKLTVGLGYTGANTITDPGCGVKLDLADGTVFWDKDYNMVGADPTVGYINAGALRLTRAELVALRLHLEMVDAGSSPEPDRTIQ